MGGVKELRAAHYLGSLLCVLGLVMPQFLVIRPNRVENGYGLTFFAALNENGFLWLSSIGLIGLMGLTIGLIMLPQKNLVLQQGIHIVSFTLFLYITGRLATEGLSHLGTSARASLGLGFWSFLIGLLLFVWQMLKQRISYNQKSSNKHTSSNKLWTTVLYSSVVILLYYSGAIDSISLVREFTAKSDRILAELMTHLQLSLTATLIGFIIALCLSYLAYQNRSREGVVNFVANIAQVIPTLSLLGLLMIPLTALAATFPLLKEWGISGIGFFPAFIVLTLYTLLPITTNAIAGFRSIPTSILEAAQAMGMSRFQRLVQVELPMALPSLLMGFRIALVQTVGNCILAGLVGGGGLGTLLFLGLAQSAPDLVLVASLLVVCVGFVCEVVLSEVEIRLKYKLRGELSHD
jgi:osmoprotectant transport system permease protein